MPDELWPTLSINAQGRYLKLEIESLEDKPIPGGFPAVDEVEIE